MPTKIPRITPIIMALVAVAIATAVTWAIATEPALADRPPAPSGIAVSATDENTVNVIWTAHPDGAKNYRVAWKPADEGWKAWDNYDWNAYPSGTSHTITGLDPGTTYRVRVKARFETGPASGWSSVSTVTTPEAEEDENIGRSSHFEVPTSVTFTNRNTVGGTVHWNAPTDPATTHVRIDWVSRGTYWQHIREASDPRSFEISNLDPGNTYHINVSFGTSNTTFGGSRSAQLTTPPIPTPGNLRLTNVTWTKITATWNAPTDPGISNIKLSIRGPGRNQEFNLLSTSNTVNWESLQPNATYTVEVRFGTSSSNFGNPASRSATTRTIPTPTNLQVSSLQSDRVDLTWDNPTTDPDAQLRPSIQRITELGEAPETANRLSPGVTGYRDSTSSITIGERYRYELRFATLDNNGTFHYGPTVSVVVTIPHELRPQEVTARTGQGYINIAWHSPTGLTITKHKVERRQGTSGNFAVLTQRNGEGEGYTDRHVAANTLYQYRVYVGDANGLGDYVEIQKTSETITMPDAPTNFEVLNATLINGVYESLNSDPELDWDVHEASTGNYLTRKLIEPPAGVECANAGNCPTMELLRQEGTRNTGYTDIYNGGGKYQYWIRSIKRAGTAGETFDDRLSNAATIMVQVPSQALPAQVAPTNVRVTAQGENGVADISVTWDADDHHTAFLAQFRRAEQEYPTAPTGSRSERKQATNPVNMWEADGNTFQPASHTARLTYLRNANPNPWNTTYYVRVGTCADRDCTVADVIFAQEQSAHMGANPYGS